MKWIKECNGLQDARLVNAVLLNDGTVLLRHCSILTYILSPSRKPHINILGIHGQRMLKRPRKALF